MKCHMLVHMHCYEWSGSECDKRTWVPYKDQPEKIQRFINTNKTRRIKKALKTTCSSYYYLCSNSKQFYILRCFYLQSTPLDMGIMAIIGRTTLATCSC